MVSRFIEPASLETSGMSLALYYIVSVWNDHIWPCAAISQPVQTEQKRRRLTLPSIAELNFGHKLSIFRDQSLNHSANSAPGFEFPSFRDEQEVTVLKIGVLFRTSLGQEEDSRPGPTRQRRFRLTEGALEYLHHFSHVGSYLHVSITSSFL